MNNRQNLTKKQVYRLQRERVDLSQASMVWMRLENNKPIAVQKDFAQWFFLPDTVEACTICPAPTLSDIMETILPASFITDNNLMYLLTIQSADTKDGKRYRAGYLLNTISAWTEEIPTARYTTGDHDNALDAAYELIMTLLAEDRSLLNFIDNEQ